ncbi:MAG TPA: hypothetical protein VFU69_13840 [Ktedonobacterales bacterium]|nr:hypothetical protein [Ktedonobacterales bacterium]
MTRQAASTAILKNIILLFLIFFLVFALLGTGLAFLYQSLLGALFSVPAFIAFAALFALIPTLIIRQGSVEEVPRNTVGLVTSSNGTLKTLAPAGRAWVWFGRERLSGFLSLEPTSMQAPILGLKSGDGAELAPLVMLITWRIDSKITTLFSGTSHQQVKEVALESQAKRERRVREKVTEVLGRRAMQARLADLEEDMPYMHANSFGQAVILEINLDLAPIGLSVERLECIGSITTPTKASVAVKRIGAARKKLENLLRAGAADTAFADLQGQIDALLQRARLAVQGMSAASRACNDYVEIVITVLEQASKYFKTETEMKAANAAQKTQSERLTELAAELDALLESASKIKRASDHIGSQPTHLTPEEAETLFKVLEAVEQKRVSLGSIFA